MNLHLKMNESQWAFLNLIQLLIITPPQKESSFKLHFGFGIQNVNGGWLLPFFSCFLVYVK